MRTDLLRVLVISSTLATAGCASGGTSHTTAPTSTPVATNAPLVTSVASTSTTIPAMTSTAPREQDIRNDGVPRTPTTTARRFRVVCPNGSSVDLDHYPTTSELLRACPDMQPQPPVTISPRSTTTMATTTTTVPRPRLVSASFTLDGKPFGGLIFDERCGESVFAWKATFSNGVTYAGSFTFDARKPYTWRLAPNPAWNGVLYLGWDGCSGGSAGTGLDPR